MRNRRIGKRDKILYNSIKLALFIAASFLALKVGVFAGNTVSRLDAVLVKDADVENFKWALNVSLPIIDTTYNSGSVNVSYVNEINKMVQKIFGFDFDSPPTILNAGSPYLSSYYNKTYLQMLAENDSTEGQGTIAYWEQYGNVPNNNGAGQTGADGFLTDASSISTNDEDQENRVYTKENIIPHGKIELRNNTKNKITDAYINTLLKEPLKFSLDRSGPKALIYHTHTTEAYLKSISELNKKVPNWTLDEHYNVIRVGDELANQLRKTYGMDVIHNGTVHNYPNTTGFYTRSRDTVQKIIKGNPSIRLMIDVHRDGVRDEKLRVVKTINGKATAQIMFVIGTVNPNWRENFKLALKLQNKLNEIAPGLARPIYLDNYTYNQDMGYGALIVEMGGDGNVISESVESAKYLAGAINEVVK